MVRKILALQDDRLALNLPLEYVGKTVEILIFPVESEEKIEKQIKQEDTYNLQSKDMPPLAITEDNDDESLEVPRDEIYGLSLDDDVNQSTPSLEIVQEQEDINIDEVQKEFESIEDEESVLQKCQAKQPLQETLHNETIEEVDSLGFINDEAINIIQEPAIQTSHDTPNIVPQQSEIIEEIPKSIEETTLSTPPVSTTPKEENSHNIPPQSSNKEEECVFSGIKILVAEDNDINQKLITTVLKSLGLQVEIAQNGLIAFQKRQSSNYDLIFMDIAMPVMDGIQATKNILQYEKENNLKHIPIVALTANALQGDRERFVGEGLDEYMAKPIKRSVIAEMIKMFICIKPQDKPQNIPNPNPQVPHAQDIKVQAQPTQGISPSLEEQNIPSKQNIQMAQKDILVCKKSAVETNITKSILAQSGYTVESCTTPEELEQKLKSIYFRLVIFDCEVLNLNVGQVANWIHNAQNIHNQREIKSIMFCNLTQNIPSSQTTLFSKIVKGMIGRAEFENMIKEII